MEKNINEVWKDIISKLKDVGYGEEQIDIMKKSKTMMQLLYYYELKNGKYKKDNQHRAGYSREDNTIFLGDGYREIITLAHELGHAIGKFQSEGLSAYQSRTAEDYAKDQERGEAEAIAYEEIVFSEIREHLHSIHEYEQIGTFWLDDAVEETESTAKQNEDIAKIAGEYAKLLEGNLYPNDKDKAEKILDKLANFNAIMVPSGQDRKVKLTYDEKAKLEYLMRFSGELNSDYEEVVGVKLIEIKEGSDSGVIYNNPVQIKSLTNRLHNNSNGIYDSSGSKFLGVSNEDENLFNQYHAGTPLSRAYGEYDLIYGGKGRDNIKGSNYKEIIIGGSDDDTIKGMGGNDVLAGNAGDDILDGGEGSNRLVGGLGYDTYILSSKKKEDIDFIFDIDGNGVLQVDGKTLDLLRKYSSHRINQSCN